tara:strand:- start:275 stop:469 length:195 start_codon:yes stop_codon:yes gene_type:complete
MPPLILRVKVMNGSECVLVGLYLGGTISKIYGLKIGKGAGKRPEKNGSLSQKTNVLVGLIIMML